MGKDQNKPIKKINVIDIVIIILILALIATVVYRVYNEVSNDASGKKSDIVVTFECKEQYDSIMRYLSDGDAVYSVSDGSLIGYLYDEDLFDGVGAVYSLTEQGETTPSDSELSEEKNTAGEGVPDIVEANRVYQKIEMVGQMKLAIDAVKAKNAEYYIINDKNITNGSVMEVYTNDVVFTIMIVNIEEDAQ